MEKFIRATSTHNEHLIFIDPSKQNFKKGELVKVTDGAFKDIEGYIARISGQQRVAITIKGLGTLATAYIPKAFLEKISS